MASRVLIAAPPDVLRWSPRSDGHGDCAVAALELACGVTYENALTVAVCIRPDVLKAGMTWKEIQKAAKILGFSTRLKREFDLEEDTGILHVIQPHVKDSSHAVYLWEGRIIEPMSSRRQLWLHAADYISHYHYQAPTLLTLRRKE
jgi:hypothetical protein